MLELLEVKACRWDSTFSLPLGTDGVGDQSWTHGSLCSPHACDLYFVFTLSITLPLLVSHSSLVVSQIVSSLLSYIQGLNLAATKEMEVTYHRSACMTAFLWQYCPLSKSLMTSKIKSNFSSCCQFTQIQRHGSCVASARYPLIHQTLNTENSIGLIYPTTKINRQKQASIGTFLLSFTW